MKILRRISVKILFKFHSNGERAEGHQSEETVVDAPFKWIILVIAAEQGLRDEETLMRGKTLTKSL